MQNEWEHLLDHEQHQLQSREAKGCFKQLGLLEHLAAVQTLIIYQIIRLFDPSLDGQAQAQKQNILLETWAAHLWKRFFNESALFANCYETF